MKGMEGVIHQAASQMRSDSPMRCSLYDGRGFLRVALATSLLDEAHSSFHLPNSLSDLAGALVGF